MIEKAAGWWQLATGWILPVASRQSLFNEGIKNEGIKELRMKELRIKELRN